MSFPDLWCERCGCRKAKIGPCLRFVGGGLEVGVTPPAAVRRMEEMPTLSTPLHITRMLRCYGP